MLGEPQRHRRSARLIASRLCIQQETERLLGTHSVVLKKLQVDQGIPGGVTFGKRMGLAGQGFEPIAEGAVDTLNVNGCRFGDHLAQGGTDLDGEQLPMLVPMLDSLRQAHLGRHHQQGASALARAYRLTIGSSEDHRIAPPAIAAPVLRMALRACDGEGHRSLDEIVAGTSGGAGSDEAAGAILHEASPAFAGIGFVGGTVFFVRRTKTRRFRPSRVADPA